MEDRVSLYPGRVTLTPVEGQPNTYDMVRADQPTQTGTPLSKANLLKDLTAAQFGLDSTAVPDDVLSWIGKYNEHWWSLLHGEAYSYTEYGYEQTDINSDVNILPAYTSKDDTFAISYSQSVSMSGSSIMLNNPITKTYIWPYDTNSNMTSLRTKIYNDLLAIPLPAYIQTSKASTIYYLPSGSTINKTTGHYNHETVSISCSKNSDDDYRVYLYLQIMSDNGYTYPLAQYLSVTSTIIQVPAGETTYEHSTDRNAYPDSGTVDGIVYTYLGVPFEKFPRAKHLTTLLNRGTISEKTTTFTIDVSDVDWNKFEYVLIDLDSKGSGYIEILPNGSDASNDSWNSNTNAVGIVGVISCSDFSRIILSVAKRSGRNVHAFVEFSARGGSNTITYADLKTLVCNASHSEYYINAGSTWEVRGIE